METSYFSKVPLLKRFKIVSKKKWGIRIHLDCVVGVQFKVNAVYTSGRDKGKLFFVNRKTKVAWNP